MSEKKTSLLPILLSTLATLLPLFYGLLLLPILPESLPSHFNVVGEPDHYTKTLQLILAMPLGLAALNLLCLFFTLKDPKNQGYNAKYIKVFLYFFMPVLTNIVMGTIYLKGLGYNISVSIITSLFVGILFIILGNYLPKITQNYTFGVKLPWTLDDPENWRKTQRLSAFLFVIGGFILILSGLFSSYFPSLATVLIFGVIIAILLIPTAYSYWLSKKTSA